MKMDMKKEMEREHYKKLLFMAILSFISMFVLMYAMVNTFANVFININQFYMAGLMTAPMIIIEMALMGSMYMDKKQKCNHCHNKFYYVDCILCIHQTTKCRFRRAIFEINDPSSRLGDSNV